VIARNDDQTAAAVLAAAAEGLGAPLGSEAHERHPSSHGKYVSHRLKVPCASAEAVLGLYARLRAVDGVITIL
jgi:putative lipoic acid-binding regulatory protein